MGQSGGVRGSELESIPSLNPNRLRWLIAAFCIGILPCYFNGFYNPILARNPTGYWIVEALTWIVMPLIAVAAITRSGSTTLNQLGFHTRCRGVQNPWLLIALCVAVPVLMVWADGHFLALGFVVFPDNPGALPFEYTQVLPPRGPQTGFYRLAAILYMGLSAGFVEEFYFRGLLRTIFGSGRWRSIAFVIGSSLLFAGAHWEGGAAKLVYAGCWGLMLAMLYVSIDNLWPLIVAHVIVDCGWLWRT